MVKVATGVKCVDADVFIQAYAEHLLKQGEVEVPTWCSDVKTAVRKQMPPQDPNWLYTRIASVARQLYIHPKGVGVGQLARFYGGRRRNQNVKKHFSKSSRGLIRYSINELVKLNLVETIEQEVDEDRVEVVKRLSSKGVSDMDKVAHSCETGKASGRIQDVAIYKAAGGDELEEDEVDYNDDDDYTDEDDSEDL